MRRLIGRIASWIRQNLSRDPDCAAGARTAHTRNSDRPIFFPNLDESTSIFDLLGLEDRRSSGIPLPKTSLHLPAVSKFCLQWSDNDYHAMSTEFQRKAIKAYIWRRFDLLLTIWGDTRGGLKQGIGHWKVFEVQYKSERRPLLVGPLLALPTTNSQGELRDFLIVKLCTSLNELDSDDGELIAYMGIVHWEQKDRGEDSLVYGLITNTYGFRYFMIDAESKVFSSAPPQLSPNSNPEDISTTQAEWENVVDSLHGLVLPHWYRQTATDDAMMYFGDIVRKANAVR